MPNPTSRAVALRAGLAVFAISSFASPAAAADALLRTKLAPEISKRCMADAITAKQLGEAIYASGAVKLTAEYGWNQGGPQLIAVQAFSGQPGPNREALNRLRRLTETWVDPTDPSAEDYLPVTAGGVSVSTADEAAVPRGRSQEVLAAILSGEETNFRFHCRTGAPQTDPPAPGKPGRTVLSIAKAPEDLSLKLSDKKFAELAYVSNQITDEDSYSVYATAGLSWGEFTPIRRRPGRPGALLRIIPSIFAQLEREGSDKVANADETNNLNFGAQLSGFLQTRGRRTLEHYFSLSGRYLTDTHFRSEAWAASARITPGLPIPGNDQPYDIVPNKVEFIWTLSGVADYIDVVDPGRKAKLLTSPQFTRLGFDAFGQVRFLLSDDRKRALSLSADYRVREDLGGAFGDADLLSLKLLFEPVPRFSFGIAFDQGKNLDSLERRETWKIVVGIRN